MQIYSRPLRFSFLHSPDCHYINTVEKTYSEYCETGEDALIAKHFFGEKPQLIGIFYNLLRRQVNYEEAKADFENQISNSTPYKRDIILNSEINNYIDIARKVHIEIIKEYSLMELKKMYAAVYKTNPTSNYTKERIIGVLRNRMHTMKRAESFGLSVEERNKRTVNSF